jgi:1-acyl-sn-glycerol-3-phosphate acyltransferase
MIFIRPLSPTIHERIIAYFTEVLFGSIVNWSEAIGGLEVIVTGDKIPGSAIVMSNHVSFTDSVAIHCVARDHGELGHVRSFAKQSLAFFPVFGWFLKVMNHIFVSRSWNRDKGSVRRQLHELARKANLCSTGNFWLMIFPEGTRIKSSKLKEGQEFSKSRGLPIYKHLLVPRVKGLHASIDGAQDAVEGIIDMTVGYSEWTKTGHARPSVGDMMFGGGRKWPVHVHMRFYQLGEVPRSEEEVAVWLRERWEEKDKLLDTFKKTGEFPGEVHAYKRHTISETLSNIAVMVLLSAAAVALFCASYDLASGVSMSYGGSNLLDANPRAHSALLGWIRT